ncbi:MAG: aminotransferase-like domain-containing protein, partial [Terriglobales bacterium]
AAVESPGYPDARHILHRAGAEVQAVPVDDSGLRVSRSLSQAALVYVTPSHQFPTNVTLSIARRRRLLDMAIESGQVLVEDDYDSEFRFEGRPTPALKALDRAGNVVYLGSFSKFLAPGIRLGYLVGSARVIRELQEEQRYQLRHPPGQLQRAIAIMLRSGDYSRHLRRQRIVLKRRWRLMSHVLEECLPSYSKATTGGTSLWVTGPRWLDSTELADWALAEGIVIEPGAIYFAEDPAPRNSFRLGFAAVSEEAIVPGIRRLAAVIEQLVGA